MTCTSLTGVLSSSPSLQLSEESDGAFTLSMSSIRDELTMDTAVIRPYRSSTANTFCRKQEGAAEWQLGAQETSVYCRCVCV